MSLLIRSQHHDTYMVPVHKTHMRFDSCSIIATTRDDETDTERHINAIRHTMSCRERVYMFACWVDIILHEKHILEYHISLSPRQMAPEPFIILARLASTNTPQI